MATETSANGVVKIGTDNVGEVTSYSVNWSSDTVEDTVLGDAARTYKASLKSYTASIDALFDPANTAQGALEPGESITFSAYPQGETSGDTYYTGAGIVTGVTINGSVGEMISVSFEVQGSGDLTPNTV